MSRYRIVRRKDPITFVENFVAQKKWFGFLWVDLPFISYSPLEGYPSGAENPSRSLELVKNFVERERRHLVVVEYD